MLQARGVIEAVIRTDAGSVSQTHFEFESEREFGKRRDLARQEAVTRGYKSKGVSRQSRDISATCAYVNATSFSPSPLLLVNHLLITVVGLAFIPHCC
jgi:hypothetical protein